MTDCKRYPKALYNTLGKLTGNNKEKVIPTLDLKSVVEEKMSTTYIENIKSENNFF